MQIWIGKRTDRQKKFWGTEEDEDEDTDEMTKWSTLLYSLELGWKWRKC